MPRLIYGYRVRNGLVELNPGEAPIVTTVLQARRGDCVRALRSHGIVLERNVIRRIRAHAMRYRAGVPRTGMPPDPGLAFDLDLR